MLFSTQKSNDIDNLACQWVKSIGSTDSFQIDSLQVRETICRSQWGGSDRRTAFSFGFFVLGMLFLMVFRNMHTTKIWIFNYKLVVSTHLKILVKLDHLDDPLVWGENKNLETTTQLRIFWYSTTKWRPTLTLPTLADCKPSGVAKPGRCVGSRFSHLQGKRLVARYQ